MTELNKIIDIIKKLRDPKDGCPWDRKQTHSAPNNRNTVHY